MSSETDECSAEPCFSRGETRAYYGNHRSGWSHLEHSAAASSSEGSDLLYEMFDVEELIQLLSFSCGTVVFSTEASNVSLLHMTVVDFVHRSS